MYNYFYVGNNIYYSYETNLGKKVHLMKNILFLHSSSELYGSDKSLLNLIINLDKSKYKIFVLLPQDGPLVKKLEKINNVNVIFEDFAILRRKNLNFIGLIKYGMQFIKSINFINKLIKKYNINIVYTNTAVVFVGAISAKLMRKKSVWHIREIISNNFERKIVSRVVNRYADIIIANSKATGLAITDDKEKLRIIYNAIDTTNVDLEVNEKSNDGPVTIGMAGRINRWKGQKLFIDVAELISKKDNNLEFLIAGSAFEGEDFLVKELEEYIIEKHLGDKVKLLGLVENMNSFYNQIDIFILPSTQPEPFGLVVLEAMARGIPVVATNHGGPTEIITNGKNGFLVSYDNPNEMSKIICELIDNKEFRYNIGHNGKKNQEINFSINSYVNDIEFILNYL